jgi:hypothetical protein
MFLSKLQGVGAALLAAALGVAGLTYCQAAAQTPAPAAPAAARPAADELEALRLEVAALRKELEATRQRVKALEQKQQTPGRTGGPAAGPVSPLGVLGQQKTAAGQQPAAGTSANLPLTAAGQQPAAGTPANLPLTTAGQQPAAGTPVAQGQGTTPVGQKKAADPLSSAEQALNRLRHNPADQGAVRALEQALQALRPKQGTTPAPTKP